MSPRSPQRRRSGTDRVRHAYFRAKTRAAAPQTLRLFDSLLQTQQLDPEELARRQQHDALAIARFAAASSPFYQRLYAAAGIALGDLVDLASFQRLPVVTRALLREHNADVRTPEYLPAHVEERRTGGSTGEPLLTATDRRFPTQALVWRMYDWWGVAPYDHVGHLGVWSPTPAELLRYRLRWWPTRHLWANPGVLDTAVKQTFVEQIRRQHVALVEGYVGAVAETARYAGQHGRPLPELRAVAVTAAPLTPAIREDIQRGLGAPVYDQYRCAEVPFLAAECREQRGLHVFADHRLLELVDENDHPVPPGEEGAVVVTDLRNRVFPVVRYRLGDRGRYLTQPCPCGVTLPLIEPPKGRLTTVLRLPDGSAMASGIAGFFAGVPDAVRQFRIHQRADYSVTINVVLGAAPSAREQVEGVVESFRQRARGLLPVTVDYVDQIPHERGKIRFVICDVPDPS